ncbi:hypothetical protein [Marinobacter sp. JSM 1782161]|uniref:hypothetical protein n=1 Tax=Marinobacter sp. JSM 1782161 TaxID=2685906 RepID=UPI0014037FCF|nr:hypothetical protein [Marinobacter sp. JSM 1782161]
MANRSLGVLTLDLVAKIGGFTEPLDKAARQAKKDMSQVRDDVAKTSKAFAGISAAATAAAGGVVAFTSNAAQNAREIKNLSTLANTSTEEFQKLSYAALSVGVEQDKLADILKDVNDRVGDFISTGGGEMADFFENIAPKVGVTADQFARLSGPQALGLYIESLQEAGLSQQEMTFYMEAVADDATRLIPLLQNGGRRFAEISDEADKLGIVLSDIEIQRLEDFAGEFDQLTEVAKSMGDILAAELAPHLQDLTDTLIESTEGAGGLRDVLSDPAFDQAISAVIDGLSYIDEAALVAAASIGGRLITPVATLTASFAAGSVENLRYQSSLARMAGVSKTAAVSTAALSAATKGLSASMALLGGPAGIAILAAGAIYEFRDELFTTSRAATELEKDIDASTRALTDFTKAELESKRTDVANQLVERRTEAYKLRKELEKLEETERLQNITNQGRPGGSTSQASVMRARLEQLESEGDALSDYFDALGDRQDELDRLSKSKENLKNRQTLEAINKEISALQLQADTLGLTEDEAKLYRLELEGATPAQLEHAAAILKTISAYEDQVEAQKEAAEEQARINDQATQIEESLRSQEEAIRDSYERRREIILDSTNKTEQEKADLLKKLEAEKNQEINELNASFWENYLAAADRSLNDFDELAGDVLESLTSRFGDAFESMVFDAESLGDAVYGIAEEISRSLVNALGQVAAQWLVNESIRTAISESGQAAAVASAAATGASIASAYAPAAAAVSLASFGANSAPAIAGMTGAYALSETLALTGMAHEGIESIPKTGTWLLEEGERVTPAKTSAKLDDTLERVQQGMQTNDGANGGGVRLRILNTTDPDEIREFMGSSAGEQEIMNVVKRNQRTIKTLSNR